MNKTKFQEYIKDYCKNNSIVFKEFDGKHAYTVMTNSECRGFFEENKEILPTLGIANGLSESEYYEILVHEFCHAQQYKENTNEWVNSRLTKEEQQIYSTDSIDLRNKETGDLFTYWLENLVELPEVVVEDLLNRTIEVEFDCEKRSIQLINQMKLDININEYTQKANAYIISYVYAKQYREWISGLSSDSTFYKTLPSELDLTFCKNLNNDVLNNILKYKGNNK